VQRSVYRTTRAISRRIVLCHDGVAAARSESRATRTKQGRLGPTPGSDHQLYPLPRRARNGLLVVGVGEAPGQTNKTRLPARDRTSQAGRCTAISSSAILRLEGSGLHLKHLLTDLFLATICPFAVGSVSWDGLWYYDASQSHESDHTYVLLNNRCV
jgi:hypothetical protein